MNPARAAQAVAEQRVLEMLRKLSPPELRETANGFDPEDGSPLQPVVLGVPRERFIALARLALVNPKAGLGSFGEGPLPPPLVAAPSRTPGRWPLVIGGLALVAVVGWFIVRDVRVADARRIA